MGGEASFANDVSNDGVVVGYAGEAFYVGHPPGHGHAFVYDSKDAALTELDPLPRHIYAVADARIIGYLCLTMQADWRIASPVPRKDVGEREIGAPGRDVSHHTPWHAPVGFQNLRSARKSRVLATRTEF